MSAWRTYRVPVRVTQVLTYDVYARSVEEAADRAAHDPALDPVDEETLCVEVDYYRGISVVKA